MPDGMSSENRPNVDPFASINSMGLSAAKEFPQPESKAHIPDIRMSNEKKEPTEIDPAEAAMDDAVNRLIGREAELNMEMATNPETPAEFFEGLRAVQELQEDGYVPKEAQDRWTPTRLHSAVYFKAKALETTISELKAKNRLEVKGYKDIDGNTWTGLKPSKSKFATYAISHEPYKAGLVNSGRYTSEHVDYKFDYGEGDDSECLRTELACAVKKGLREYQARLILGEHISIRTSLRFRDSLEDLVNVMHGGSVTYFKGDHLKALFNMPSVAELENRIKLSDEDVKSIEKMAEQKEKETFRDSIIKKEFENKHELGDQLEEAIFLNMIMLNSSGKERMQNFIKKPGAIRLIERLADKDQELVDRVKSLPPEEQAKAKHDLWVAKYIGNLGEWTDDSTRILEDIPEERKMATWREETEKKYRTELTKWANISAWGGNPSEFSASKEIQFIEKAIGDVVGSREAAWLAATFLRSIGAYASEGYAVLSPDGEGKMKHRFLLPLGEGRYISGDDTGKFYANLFNLKEGLKGRSSGLKDMIGRIPDMAMNLFDWAGVEVEGDQYPMNWDGTKQRRSVWDAWLGTEERPLKGLLTDSDIEVAEINDSILRSFDSKTQKMVREHSMKYVEVLRERNDRGGESVIYKPLDFDTNDRINNGRLEARTKNGEKIKEENEKENKYLWILQEDGQRLGDLDFESLEREFHGTFTIMQWLMGNGEGPTGVFVDALKTNFRPEDFELNELKKKIKYIGIVMNPVVLTKGSQHLYKNAAGDAGVIRDSFFSNLMSARKHSFSFAQNIWGATTKLFNPAGGVVDASTPVLIDMFIEEAKKKSGLDSAVDLVQHYVDENIRLRTNAGYVDPKKISSVVDSANLNDKNIGRIKGKNIY